MSDHPWLEEIPAYALGALADEERDRLEAHLEVCAECRAELAAHSASIQHLAGLAPSRVPPPGLRERILSGARTAGEAGGPRGVDLPSEGTGPSPPVPVPERRPVVFPWLAAAAMLLLALGSMRTLVTVRADRAALEEDLGVARAELSALRSELTMSRLAVAERDALLDALASPELRMAELASPDTEPRVRGFWNPDRAIAVFAVSNLPPPPLGRTYQLWGIPDGGDPVSLGAFTTAADGRAVVTATPPDGSEFALSAVTEEPAGGSNQPTSTPFLVGSWTGT